MQSCGRLGLEGRSRLPALERGRGACQKSWIRLGRGTRLSSLNLHPKPTTRGLVSIREHLWVLGQATGTLTHLTHHGPDSGGSHHLPPYSILCNSLHELHPNGTFSRNSQEGVPKLSQVRLPGLWTLTTPGSNL